MYSLDSLSHIVTNHPVVRHEFLTAFRQGALTKEQVKHWAIQQSFFSRQLPDCFAALYGRIPYYLWKEKYPLLELLDIEAWGSTAVGCHSKLFLEFACFLGLDVNKLTKGDERWYTQEFLSKRFDLCANLSRPLAQGLSAIGLGNEIANLEFFGAYQEGINRIAGLEKCPTDYFKAHERDEISDFEVFNRLFRMIAGDGKTVLIEAEKGLYEILGARVVFFNALYKDLR